MVIKNKNNINMTRHLLLILTILTSLIGCDFSKKIKETVDSRVKDDKVEMNKNISESKFDFTKSYNQTISHLKDSSLSVNVDALYSSVFKTSKYIDSLRTEMDKLDEMDTRNVELIKQIFLYDGIGDSVFNKVRYSYSLTIDIAVADTTKTRLRKVKETYNEETQKLFFELNSPLGVNIILYSIESELIKDGTRCLAGHSTK